MYSTRIENGGTRPQRRDWGQILLAAALCLPGALLTLATAVMLAGVPFGIDPLWRVEPLTLPEAAATRDNAEAVRLITLGVNPNEPGPVRAGIVHSTVLVITPLEAAAAARRADMIETLLEHGAVMDAAVWTRLWCIADVRRSSEVQRFLDDRRPADAGTTCTGVHTPWSAEEP